MSSVWDWRSMVFLLVLFLCRSIIVVFFFFFLLDTNTASGESLPLPTTQPDEQITTMWQGMALGGGCAYLARV